MPGYLAVRAAKKPLACNSPVAVTKTNYSKIRQIALAMGTPIGLTADRIVSDWFAKTSQADINQLFGITNSETTPKPAEAPVATVQSCTCFTPEQLVQLHTMLALFQNVPKIPAEGPLRYSENPGMDPRARQDEVTANFRHNMGREKTA